MINFVGNGRIRSFLVPLEREDSIYLGHLPLESLIAWKKRSKIDFEVFGDPGHGAASPCFLPERPYRF